MSGPDDIEEIALKVVDHVDALLGYWDQDLLCRFANTAYESWFGRPRSEIMGISMPVLLGPLFEQNLVHIKGALAGETQIFERQIQIADGSVRDTLATYYPDTVDGVVVGFSVHVSDVTRLKLLERELEEAHEQTRLLATHDFLTGLPNRVLLMDRIDAAIARAKRSQSLFAVVALDLDRFKSINDTFGHIFGDGVLREVSRRMQSVLREADTVTRWGGDEFILLVDQVGSHAEVCRAVVRVQSAVAKPYITSAGTVMPGCTCGIAMFPADGETSNDLLLMADRALYRAKEQAPGTFAPASSPQTDLPDGLSMRHVASGETD